MGGELALREVEADEVDVQEVYLVLAEETRFLVALDELDALADEVLLMSKDVAHTSDY